VLAALDGGATTLDELARTSGLEPGPLAGSLALLELAHVVSVEDGVVRRTRAS
jgi:hypothetical protein